MDRYIWVFNRNDYKSIIFVKIFKKKINYQVNKSNRYTNGKDNWSKSLFISLPGCECGLSCVFSDVLVELLLTTSIC